MADTGAKQKVLLADDSAIQRTQLRRALERSGFIVIEGSNGQEGLDALNKHPDVKLVVADLNMPVMDGLTMIERIRKMHFISDLHIIVVTTESGGELRLRGRELGVAAWIIKPWDPAVLSASIERLLGKSAARASVSKAAVEAAPQKKRILLVDDSSIQRVQMRKILENANFSILEATNGAEGLASAEHNPDIRLIIADVNMPVMDGMTMAERVRQIAGFQNIPILMVTTEFGRHFRSEARRIGIVGWIMKPVNPENLISVVEQILRGVSQSRSEFKV